MRGQFWPHTRGALDGIGELGRMGGGERHDRDLRRLTSEAVGGGGCGCN
jgi:hypothetical protein